ncbi:DUF3108 domain-containing protein [uncultured Desulfobulbus sp.]|uniref:DUF3108 domain-containing protein n=1 Tax=uncultured Desulfobulbus sp. TaxID=239745 RepID=UPI0029C8708C|nr:DUF3108 domain-containing protein [uncultured Desulfobulbus sp.]
MRSPTRLFLFWFLLGLSSQGSVFAEEVLETRPSQVNQATLAVIFSGSETLHYAVSWSGGMKIGDIYMKIQREKAKDDAFNISAKVKDYGPLELFYPVDDTFNCFVSGPMKLPYRYEVQQKEGYRKETKRLTHYDQANLLVRYQKNREPEEQFEIAGTVYNEFASFIITRALALQEGADIVVPTFADKKRQEVKVALLQREKRQTVFGEKETLKVLPKMYFKGLYEKSGDTILWLTDDRCRVPVEIHSKIAIGSLVAELVEYANSACPELRRVKDR